MNTLVQHFLRSGSKIIGSETLCASGEAERNGQAQRCAKITEYFFPGASVGYTVQCSCTAMEGGTLCLDHQNLAPERNGSAGFESHGGYLNPKEKRIRQVSRIARNLIALSRKLPDPSVAKRFLANAVRFERVIHNQPVFGEKR